MAKVNVMRQSITDDNQLTWEVVSIDETELLEGEMPVPEQLLPEPGQPYVEIWGESDTVQPISGD